MAFELTPEEEATALETVREVNKIVETAKDIVTNPDDYDKTEVVGMLKTITFIAEHAFGATQMALETNQVLEQHSPSTEQ